MALRFKQKSDGSWYSISDADPYNELGNDDPPSNEDEGNTQDDNSLEETETNEEFAEVEPTPHPRRTRR